MTSISTFTQFNDAAQEVVAKAIHGNSWKMSSYLIQLLHKLENYYTSLAETDQDLYDAQVATASALELINSTYNVPVTDERFEDVSKLYDATVNLFITDYSDDAIADVVHISRLANFVADMRVYCWDQVIANRGPSETSFEALKLAKRDQKAIQLAVKIAAEVIFGDNN